MSRKTFCDRCGNQIPPDGPVMLMQLSSTARNAEPLTAAGSIREFAAELCQHCAEAAKAWVVCGSLA